MEQEKTAKRTLFFIILAQLMIRFSNGLLAGRLAGFMVKSKHMRYTFCWVCTVLGTVAALSVVALFLTPAKPFYANQNTPVAGIARPA